LLEDQKSKNYALFGEKSTPTSVSSSLSDQGP